MDTESALVVAMAWYRREDYCRILEIMEDAHLLPVSFERWNDIAQKGERSQKAKGRIVVRAIIDPQDFPGWCKAERLNVDADARRIYAAWRARQAD